MQPVSIAAHRILSRCDILAGFTEEPGQITRTFLSPPMRRVHETISTWMEQAGMTVRIDAIGNIIGHLPGQTTDSPILILGSHLDTVPNAGRFDGILGVVMAIAVVESLDGNALPFALDVIGFAEEEGVRFSTPYLGSLAAIGQLERAHLQLRDRAGISVAEVIHAFGLDPSRIPEAQYLADQTLGYIEIHIEQGPVLESLELPLGVVTAIVGQSRYQLAFQGKAGHAGTVPMRQRQDALAGAAEFILAVESCAQGIAGLVATVGYADVVPNASNVIPGRVLLSLDIRHAEDFLREQAGDALIAEAGRIATRRGLLVQLDSSNHHRAIPMDVGLQRELETVIATLGLPVHRMVSGAGHDAAIMAGAMPAAMLFVRCPGGISHHPDEAVLADDVAVALDVIVRFIQSHAITDHPRRLT